MICIPTSMGLYMRGAQVRPVNENRVLAARPEGEITQLFTSDGSYGTAIEAFYNDRFGYRDLMIRTKNQICYSVFDMTPGVYVGDDGYMSYQSLVSKVQVSNEKMSEEDMDKMVESFESIVNYLDEKEIGFFFMLAPQKNEVFPERTESFPVQRPTPNAYERLCDKFKSSNILADNFIDAETILYEAEDFYPTYYKTDFHWNGYGATVVYNEVVNACAKYDGIEEGVFSIDDYSVYYGNSFWGGQMNDIPLLYYWEPEKEVCVAKNTPITLVDGTNGEEPNNANGHYINTDANAPLGKVLLIGDSYTWFLIASNSGVLDCFQEVYWVHTSMMANAIKNYEEIVDYVVFEQVASGPESSIMSLRYQIEGLMSNIK